MTRARRRRIALPVMIGGATALAADLARRAYRESQLFCPEAQPARTWDPEDYGIPRDSVEEQWIESGNGRRLHAWYCRSEQPVASALYCHGNTGNLTTVAADVPHLMAAGLDVLLFDYRGFGRSSGRPTYRGVIADAVAAARHHDSVRPSRLPSVLYGFSLGGAIGAQVIRRHPFDALILQSTFTSLTELTRVLYPKLPMHLLAGAVFDTLRVVRELDVPLLVLHGTEDEVIPARMAGQLFEACSAPKRIRQVEGGLHKDLFTRDAQSLVTEISSFLERLDRRGEDRPLAVSAV